MFKSFIRRAQPLLAVVPGGPGRSDIPGRVQEPAVERPPNVPVVPADQEPAVVVAGAHQLAHRVRPHLERVLLEPERIVYHVVPDVELV